MPVKDCFNWEDYNYFMKVGKSISGFLESIKSNKNTYPNEIQKLKKNALILLSFINNKFFEKDILLFYEEKCISMLKDCNKDMKKIIINLAKSSWIPETYIEKKQNQKEDDNDKDAASIDSIISVKAFLL